jgi:alpha-glucuronidase
MEASLLQALINKRFAIFGLMLAGAMVARAESGYDAWLRYSPPNVVGLSNARQAIPAVISTLGSSVLETSARNELTRGLHGMLDRTLRHSSGLPSEDAILIGTFAELQTAAPAIAASFTNSSTVLDSYRIKALEASGHHYIVITGPNERGVLYGAFGLLRRITLNHSLSNIDDREVPYAPVRWLNHWDNLEGTIERGYGGRSIFWDNLKARADLSRVSDYGRLLASLGINGTSINNVNVNLRIMSPEMLPEIARIADALRPWGVQTVVSVDFGGPQRVGGLDTFDPFDPRVIAWWKSTIDGLYKAVPDLGGVVIKADSEGRVGPSVYGRTHADAANVVARALKPHGGLIFYRGFVYDNHMDWNVLTNDRARAADDNFRKLDGTFDDNVVIQIKHGPIDFQVREPASPLFGTLEKTNEAIELQITQEYFGQARHTVFLAPMWKEALDFDMRVNDRATPVKALVAGKIFNRPTGGFVGVSNVGLDENWLGNHLSQANLYAFGRLAWNPDMTPLQISQEWEQLTFGPNETVAKVVNNIQLTSWKTFEDYTGPLGLQTLTDIVGNHYGVAVEASERNGWGQWHRADDKGVGMDRTSTGTGFVQQYRPANAKMFESLATMPDELLLFMHHVPYTYKLHSGKTVIQFLYDAHYDGADAVAAYVRDWKTLKGLVDERRYQEVLTQLEYQSGQAEVWRDAVNNWFYRASNIADQRGRVGNHPGRTEAEAMKLTGYTERDVIPWEGGSGGKAISCPIAQCSASLTYSGQAGWFNLRVQYFDQNNGQAQYRVRLNDQLIDNWSATYVVPSAKIDSSTSNRRTITGVALRPGDVVTIEGMPNAGESAALDYVEIVPGSN